MENSEEDLTTLSWNDKVWLSYFPLNKSTVLEYFSRAPFYDRSCLNEQYKMQRLELSAFSNVPGMSYEVNGDLCVEPSLFVITKQERSESLEVSTKAYYYVLNGTVYQAPKASAVLTTRIVQSMFHMRQAFETLQQKLTMDEGDWYAWMPRYSLNESSGEGGNADMVSSVERQTVDRLLYGILQRNRRVMKETTRDDGNYKGTGENGGVRPQGGTGLPNGGTNAQGQMSMPADGS